MPPARVETASVPRRIRSCLMFAYITAIFTLVPVLLIYKASRPIQHESPRRKSLANTENGTSNSCSNEFLPERLVGRCWGLTKVEEFDEVPSVKAKAKKIKTAEQCQELCCELGDACITYQFWEGSGKCLIGKEVRLGKEHGSTPLWCEPHAPHKWNGRKKLSSSSSSSTGDVGKKQQQCGWGEELPYQCWDFGDERVNKTGGRLNARECAAACCQTENCIAWQELPGRGCFYNVDKLDGLDCDKSIEVYDGRRKKRASG